MSLGQELLRRAFGQPAGLLGTIGGKVMAHGNLPVARRAVQLLDVESTDHVLEVGFGPGVAVQMLAAAARSGRVAGVDPSEEMLRQASRRNARSIGEGRVELLHALAERLPFEDRSFDKALSINSMQLWTDRLAGLREIWRVLEPAGRVVLAFTRLSRQPCQPVAESLAAARFRGVRLIEDGDRDAFYVLAAKPVR